MYEREKCACHANLEGFSSVLLFFCSARDCLPDFFSTVCSRHIQYVQYVLYVCDKFACVRVNADATEEPLSTLVLCRI